jgi:hypothetical protein
MWTTKTQQIYLTYPKWNTIVEKRLNVMLAKGVKVVFIALKVPRKWRKCMPNDLCRFVAEMESFGEEDVDRPMKALRGSWLVWK